MHASLYRKGQGVWRFEGADRGYPENLWLFKTRWDRNWYDAAAMRGQRLTANCLGLQCWKQSGRGACYVFASAFRPSLEQGAAHPMSKMPVSQPVLVGRQGANDGLSGMLMTGAVNVKSTLDPAAAWVCCRIPRVHEWGLPGKKPGLTSRLGAEIAAPLQPPPSSSHSCLFPWRHSKRWNPTLLHLPVKGTIPSLATRG